jgi:predicted RNase H-like HicB family nuclease
MSNKNLEYYKGLEYSIIVEKQEMDSASWYIAYANELGKYACYGRGESQTEALNSFLEEKDGFIEYLFKEGKPIPEPSSQEPEKYSGFFNVRTSSSIHANLVHQAKNMDISLNLYINQIISAAIEKKSNENSVMDKLTELCGKLDAHHFEVTKQLRYQSENFFSKYDWASDYEDHPYKLKIA